MSSNLITMSLLGKYGRFGNQLFQYAFLQTYARTWGLEVQTAPWVGEDLFGLPSRPVTVKLPAYEERHDNTHGIYKPLLPVSDEASGHDFCGYAQYHTSYYSSFLAIIRNLFWPRKEVLDRLAPALVKFQDMGRTRIGIHIRRGDYGRLIHYITPVAWYKQWLTEHWQAFDDPVLFMATEDRALAKEFAEYSPVLAEDLGINLKTEPLPSYTYLHHDMKTRDPHQMDFYPDFWLLQNCEVIAAGNSTFSFVAAMLNVNLQQFWRSHLPTQSFVRVDPWDAHPLTWDRVEDYPHVSGIASKDNPYW
ncbi:hypothetical protein LCGC14_1850020 [marine sediment metagenome]|uniref:Glycosyl transferase family 11 n=1 Tax=marine sediment metagenome TaxID=412755 RepID=A0A0F9J9X9_9ZZZZ